MPYKLPIKTFLSFIVFLLLLCIVLINPKQTKAQGQDPNGLDVVFILDQSISNASDEEGLRFYAIGHAIRWLAQDYLYLHADLHYRVAIINFGSTPTVWQFNEKGSWLSVSPDDAATWQAQSTQVMSSIETMRSIYNANQGQTAIDNAILQAVDLFKFNGGNQRRAVILISDLQAYRTGESYGETMESIRHAFEEFTSTRLYVLAVGFVSGWADIQAEWEELASNSCEQGLEDCSDISGDRVNLVENNQDLVRSIEAILYDLTADLGDSQDLVAFPQALRPDSTFYVPDGSYYLDFSYVNPGVSDQESNRVMTITDPLGTEFQARASTVPIITLGIPDPLSGDYSVDLQHDDPNADVLIRIFLDQTRGCNASVYDEIAEIYITNGDLESASSYLIQALTQCPSDRALLEKLTEVLSDLPLVDVPPTICDQAIYDQIGQIFENQAEYEKAMDFYVRQILECPDTSTTANLTRALQEVANLQTNSPTCLPSVYGKIADAFMEQGQVESAVDHYIQAMIHCPEDDQSSSGLDEALKVVQDNAATKINADLEIAQAYLENGKYDEAISQYQTVLKLDPTNQTAKNGVQIAVNKSKSQLQQIWDSTLAIVLNGLLPIILVVFIGIIVFFAFSRIMARTSSGNFAILPFVNATGEENLKDKEESLRILVTDWLSKYSTIFDESVSIKKIDTDVPDFGIPKLSLLLWFFQVRTAPNITLIDATMIGKYQDTYEDKYQHVVGLVLRQRSLTGKKVQQIRKFLKPIDENATPELNDYVDLTMQAASWIDKQIDTEVPLELARQFRESTSLLARTKDFLDDNRVNAAKDMLAKYYRLRKELGEGKIDWGKLDQRAEIYLVRIKELEETLVRDQIAVGEEQGSQEAEDITDQDG